MFLLASRLQARVSNAVSCISRVLIRAGARSIRDNDDGQMMVSECSKMPQRDTSGLPQRVCYCGCIEKESEYFQWIS